MPKLLTEEQIGRYRRDGFVCPVRVMSAADAAGYRAQLEALCRDRPELTSGVAAQKLHLAATWMSDIVHRPAILDAVEDLLGPDLLCWTATLFVKDSDGKSFVSWHQDGNYWGLDSEEVATAWLALSPSTVESGCMKMLPGSHEWNSVEHTETFDEHNLLTRGQVIDQAIDEAEAVNLVCQPGEISLHHVNVAHASEPNLSGDTRIGIAIRYVTPRVKQVVGERDSATLVRGEDRFGHFELEARPARDFDPAAMALHARVTAQRKQTVHDKSPG